MYAFLKRQGINILVTSWWAVVKAVMNLEVLQQENLWITPQKNLIDVLGQP
jgi:hypothetical protein